jgi:ABC-type antimicrobial peptide transport system permease subunit
MTAADQGDAPEYLRDGFALAAAGILAGTGLAFGAGRLVAGQLTGVSGADPLSYAGTAAPWVVAVVACVLPARRAAALNPLTALRRD